MKRALSLVAAGFLLIVAGCAQVDYTPYSGDQSAWKVAPGAFSKTVNGLPVYYGLPDKPYTVLGRLTTVDAPVDRQAWEAKSRGADALVIMKSKEVNDGRVYVPGTSSSYVIGNSVQTYESPGYSVPVRHQVTTSYLIKFKRPE